MTTKEFQKIVGKNASNIAVNAGYTVSYWRVALYRNSKISKERLKKMKELAMQYSLDDLQES